MKRHRWQFSLYGLFVATTAAAIYMALVANYPRLASTIGFCLLTATMLLIADRLVAAGMTPAGAKTLLLFTVFAWMLVGGMLLFVAGMVLRVAYGVGEFRLATWLIVAPLAAGGIMCMAAAVKISRRHHRRG